ncbi:hypothetical protein [Paenibacillus sp.]|uniref:hypothetical protein n=1 Tax=Paenibacillus sp. TaxID=58172 RepID=UPI002D6817A8|nr:hypothetical protein [Paenibacillus sp.]HZG87276.1 hypothetical protein [Paenibacillus sp.]
MTKTAEWTVNAEELAKAWNETLPRLLNPSDKASVAPDAKDSNVLHIHIITAGRSMYNFDFRVEYVDNREVRVDLVDAERDDVTTDERRDIVQTLIEDYVRHIHECAQQLKGLTNP